MMRGFIDGKAARETVPAHTHRKIHSRAFS
jgi:hypothetical protein